MRFEIELPDDQLARVAGYVEAADDYSPDNLLYAVWHQIGAQLPATFHVTVSASLANYMAERPDVGAGHLLTPREAAAMNALADAARRHLTPKE